MCDAVMAGEVAQVMLTNLFRKGALKGGGIFLDMYHAKGVAASTSEEALVLDQATLQQDRRQAWEALFGACNHLSNMHEDMAQSLHTTCTSAVVGSIKVREGGGGGGREGEREKREGGQGSRMLFILNGGGVRERDREREI
jgi:hypothetical protein